MNSQTQFRTAAVIVILIALFTVPVLVFGSTLTHVLFSIGLVGAMRLIYRHGRRK